ncbi:Activating signal cointegrator 1 complex subunit 3 [Nosema granulosis]|uniref:Activating signal cointegrator 1 complex subunit 3 n=1 Tax=Nosema granulosis TaxID=83296 RepID=A0A9P6H151_9MICR|nr:Activating signal cointegrator 1 complex subunit 3 [Nosema granulosis]
MEETIKKLSIKLNITQDELKHIVRQLFLKDTYQEDLLEFIGYDDIEAVEVLCEHKEYFNAEENIKERKYFTEYILPEFTTREVEQNLLVDTSVVGEDKRYFTYSKFNPVQSQVFEAVYQTNENILVCAPTGAGKTDIALLTILRALKKPHSKIAYIVPMKALASEITVKYKNTLENKTVLEFTGDTEPSSYQLSKADVIICTPEKFDAYTRKLSNVFQNTLDLIIIDEIHILQDERGPVIESIISRIFRYIELKQRTIRIIALSATLPNYQDVGEFIRASRVFNFDQTYRPVSLKTSIIGIHKKTSRLIKEEIFKNKIEDLKSQGKQVIVFVNSRQDTIYSAKLLVDESITTIPKKEIKLPDSLDFLVRHRIGVHHAGLPRNVRHYMEDRFKNGDLDILVSTSTLAWGVNLPAHAVVIRGTTFYDPEAGKFKDMGILDIFQIFGRAGRPQFKITGEACLVTENEKVDKYLDMIKNNIVIESRLLKHIVDVLNPEIYLNSVTSISTGLDWFRSTFMNARLLKNPALYGIKTDERYKEDEVLSEYILLAIKRLEECLLVKIEKNDSLEINRWRFESTEFGRISSFYYLHHPTIKNWLKNLEFIFDEESICKLILSSKDFSNIIVRGDEEYALNEICDYLKINFEQTEELKLYVLLMAHIKNYQVFKFSLKCDSSFIVKNTERILGAFIEVLIYVKKFELVRQCLVLLRKIKKQKTVKNIQKSDFNIQIKKQGQFNIVDVDSEKGYFWCFVISNDNVLACRRSRNVLRLIVECPSEFIEIEIVPDDSKLTFKYKQAVTNDETPLALFPDTNDLDITFNIVYFFSYSEFLKKFVFSLTFDDPENLFLICRTKNDSRILKQEIKTQISLRNFVEGKQINKKVIESVGKAPCKNFICVTTLKEILEIKDENCKVVFLTCRDDSGKYFSFSNILNVCKSRKTIFYEEEMFVKYFRFNILNDHGN